MQLQQRFLQPSKPVRMHMHPAPVITEDLVDKPKLKCKINRTTAFFLSKQY